jgi:hypothetical protein
MVEIIRAPHLQLARLGAVLHGSADSARAQLAGGGGVCPAHDTGESFRPPVIPCRGRSRRSGAVVVVATFAVASWRVCLHPSARVLSAVHPAGAVSLQIQLLAPLCLFLSSAFSCRRWHGVEQEMTARMPHCQAKVQKSESLRRSFFWHFPVYSQQSSHQAEDDGVVRVVAPPLHTYHATLQATRATYELHL